MMSNGKYIGEIVGGHIAILDNNNEVYYYKYSELETKKEEIEGAINKIAKSLHHVVDSGIDYYDHNGYLYARYIIVPNY